MTPKRRILLAALCLSVQVGLAAPPLRFAHIFNDNMVVQRDQDLSVWGWAKAGAEVEILLTQSREEAIAFAGKEALERVEHRRVTKKDNPKIPHVRIAYQEESPSRLVSIRGTVTANARGEWTTTLGTLKATFIPVFLAARSGTEGVAIQNLLIGEVWIASGQSNMRRGGRENLWESHGLLPNAVRYASHQARNSTPQETIEQPVIWNMAEDGIAQTFSSIPYFFGKFLHEQLKVPVGIINIAQGGSQSIEWCSRDVLEKADSPLISKMLADYDRKLKEDPDATGIIGPTNLYNARLYPIRHLNVAGVIYLQGETEALSNGLVAYQKTFPGVIQSYREALGNPDLPFGIIALQGMGSSDGYSIHSYSIARYIHLRTHKKTPHTGYIVSHDIGGGIHPNYKRPIAERAVYWALRDIYKVMNNVKKNLIKGVRFAGHQALVSFEEMELKDGRWVNPKPVWPQTNDQNDIGGFMIAGKDQVWFPGEIGGVGRLDGPTTLAISNPMVPKPVALRYAWEGWSKGNLGPFYDPIPPYRTDNWRLLPEDKLPEPGSEEAQGVKRYMDGHEVENRKLELPLEEGIAASAKNLALRYAHPKGGMLATTAAIEGLLDNFNAATFKDLTSGWSQKAMLTVPSRYYRRDRMTPTRRAKWSWLMERALCFDSFVDDMDSSLSSSEVKSALKDLKSDLERLKTALGKFPDPEVMSQADLVDRFLPMAKKEKERLEKEGVNLRKLETEMRRRPF